MSEAYQAFQFCVTTMKADSLLVASATGGVWQNVAPQGTTGPIALVGHQSGIDSNTMNGVRLFNVKLLQLVAVGPSNNYGALAAIADRIDAIFKNVRNVGLSSGGVLSMTREQELAIDEPLNNGVPYSRLGGIYRVQLQGS